MTGTAQQSRCLGLIGGLGIGATVHYYRALGKAHAARQVSMRLVMGTGAFGALGSVELIKPEPAQVDYIHETYLSLAMSGEASDEHFRGLTALAEVLLRNGADAIILAGTDLSLIFDEATTRFPH